MDLIFFKYNVEFVQEAISNNPDSCGFWYTKGLTSYRNISDIISIDRIFVEETLIHSFIKDSGFSKEKLLTFPSKTPSSLKKSDQVSFFASNDTHIFLFKNILKSLPNHSWTLFSRIGEQAKSAANKIGLNSIDFELTIPNFSEFSLLVSGNDWGPLEQKVNLDFLSANINTICIQESVIDFNERDKRMQYCSIPIFQGIVTLKNVNLAGKVCAVIGNSRYEELERAPLPKNNKVFINVNFTYGIYEDIRDNWVKDVVDACGTLNTDYAICQHPRDRGDFSKYNLIKTNASTVHSSLSESSVLVTRFSSLIHESLCLGRPVIYYNPHGEKLFYDFEPDNKCLFVVKDAKELKNALNFLINEFSQDNLTSSLDEYLSRHLGCTQSNTPSKFISEFIGDAKKYPLIKKATFGMHVLSKLKRFKRLVLSQKM